jgi:AcrR family transcriptional regulator
MLIDTESRTDTLVRAINDILIELGPGGLSMKRISERSRVNKSSIYHHLDSRERLLRVAASMTGKARMAALRAGIEQDGVLAFLPRTDDELLDTRAWLAWLELWRCEDFLNRWVSDVRDDEKALMARVMDFGLSGAELEAAVALVDGLRVAVCAPHRPMRREDARAVLAAHLEVCCTPMPREIEHPWWAWPAPA